MKPKTIASLHLRGLSLRGFEEDYGLPKSIVSRTVSRYLNNLPDNINVTKAFSNMSKFSGMLVLDGKFVPVKGYERMLPFLWGIDYLAHDIPHGMLVPSENYVACRKFFLDLKSINYPLVLLICDDNYAIKQAAQSVFPDVVIQTCWRHYLESIRKNLKIKISDEYKEFMEDILVIFSKRLTEPELVWYVSDIPHRYKHDTKATNWLIDIIYRRKELTNYHSFKNAPNTTNLIEGLNSHLDKRLDNIKGFEAFWSAQSWLNAYVLKRRLTKFKDCGKKFKHLNGSKPLELTLKNNTKLPNFF